MAGIVATEIMALAWRHWLLDRLAGRIDILGSAPLAPELSRRIGRFLVAGLDYAGEPGAEGWPVPTGGRYTKLCFSPALVRSEVKIPGLHLLPITLDDYVRYVETICGIGAAQSDDLFRLFRFTPKWLFEQTRGLREHSPAAWRLLMSNEFGLAERLHPELGRPVADTAFRQPLINGFMIIAELERAFLIMRHLGRAQAIVDRRTLLDELSRSLPLGRWLKPAQLRELHRWLEYASYSSTALRTLLFDLAPAEIVDLPAGFGPWAAANGAVAGDPGTILDDPKVRAILIKALTPPPVMLARENGEGSPGDEEARASAPVERRKPLLRNHELWRWYGLTNQILPTIALDGIRDVIPTRRIRTGKVVGPSVKNNPAWTFIADLASAMRGRADQISQAAVGKAAERYAETAGLAPIFELEANSKAGLKWARLYLPTRPMSGSGARFDHTMWLTLERDVDFWRMLLDVHRGGRFGRFRTPTARHLRPLIGILRRAFSTLYGNARWSDLTGRIIYDLAAAIGPISGNPDIAYALHVLGLKPRIQVRLGATNRGGFGKGKKARSATSRISVKRK